jgi:hypothetical protein
MAWLGRETAEEQRRAEAWRAWFVRQHPLAIASVVLSVFSLTHFGTLWVDELAGIVLGVLAVRAVRRERHTCDPGEAPRGVALAYVGIVTGVLSLICAAVIYALPRAG